MYVNRRRRGRCVWVQLCACACAIVQNTGRTKKTLVGFCSSVYVCYCRCDESDLRHTGIGGQGARGETNKQEHVARVIDDAVDGDH
jgi:hypothetical protein